MKVLSFPRLMGATIGIAVCSPLTAQQVPVESAASDSRENVVVLSPFTVDTSKDRGYAASDTLSGSRLSAPLQVTPAAIAVFTPEFIRDIGATNLEESLRYATNTERDFEERGAIATGNILYDNDVVVRMRGQPSATLSRNYFRWFANSEYYNVGRVEFSRGPNSILFGLGSPAGIINTTTKQAEFRNFREVTVRANDNDGYSGQLDINQQLTSTFALRLNTLYEQGRTWRWGEYSNKEFAHLAGTWAITPKTRFRFDLEVGNKEQAIARPWLANNGFEAWLEGGRPTYQKRGDPFIPGAHDSYSTTRPFWVVTENTGSATDWRGMAISGGSSNSRLGRENPPWGWDYAVSDFTVVPREATLIGSGDNMNVDVEAYSFFIEHEIVDNLFLELAYNTQEDRKLWNIVHDWNTPVRFDPNATLPDGSPNPFFQQLYIEAGTQRVPRQVDAENIRAVLAYEKDFGEILGSHSFAFLAQQTDLRENLDAQIEYNLNSVPGFPLTDGRNRILRRTYLDFSDGPREILPGAPINTAEIQSGWLDTRHFKKREELDSLMLAMQNSFWEGRIVTTAGIRRDKLTERSVNTNTQSAPDGIAPPAILPQDGNVFEGDTKTYGAVVRVRDWLSLVANFSDNFEPQGGIFGPDGKNIGNFSGEGEDYGIRFQLWDNRVYATVTTYETASRNRGIFVLGDLATNINRIRETLGRPLLPGIHRDSEDSVSKGTEFEITANPLPNWTLHFNFTETTTKVDNKLPRYQPMIAAERGEWEAQASTPLKNPNIGFQETIGDAMAVVDASVQQMLSDEGLKPRHHIRNSVNFFTRYSFGEGVAKGWFVGGGFNYRSPQLLTYTQTSAGNRVPYYGKSQWTFDGLAGYETKIRDGRFDLRVQLNVQNLLNERDPIAIEGDIGRVSGEWVTRRYRFPDPREFTLSAILSF